MQEKDLELFDAYLTDDLSIAEKTNFEQRLTSETNFKAAFEAYEKTTRLLEQKFSGEEDLNAFKTNLSKQSDAYFKKEVKSKKTSSFYKYAAVAVLLISVIGFYFMNSGAPVYSDYATIDNIALTQRGATNDLVKKAENAFNAKSFNEASSYLDELIIQDPNNQELKLYSGIAAIEINAFDKALTDLISVADGNSAYKYEAQWYIALAYLKQKEYDNVKIALEKIPANAPEYSKAEKLLNKL